MSVLTAPLLIAGLALSADAPPSGKYWVYFGTYTSKDGSKGIYRSELDVKTGKLTDPEFAAEVGSPSFVNFSPDGKYLYVSCFASDEVQQWDVSDLKGPKLTSTLKPGEQPNMLHLTHDGQRMYITNSLLSTMDRTDRCWVRLARVGPDGLTLDKKFDVDLTKFPTGPARGHDMLLH